MHLKRSIEVFLILLGIVLLCVCLRPVIYSDGQIRFQMLSRLLERGEASTHYYSFVGPLFSAPLWFLGRLSGTSEWWCARFNVLIFGVSILALYRLLAGSLERSTLHRFLLLLITASMFPFHVTTYFAEMFTACLVTVGLAAAIFRGAGVGWLLVVIGVLNTPGTMAGLALLGMFQALQTKRWRYLAWVVVAVALNLAENWIRRSSPLDSGLVGYSIARTMLPYSGRPGFSYPLLFGLISILLSFGRGLVFFTPGVFLSAPGRFASATPELRRFYQLAIAFLIGLILLYSKWHCWYGGVFWGPRYFLFASVPAALILALRLEDLSGSLLSRLVTAGALLLSTWVAIDGIAFGNTNLEICTDRGYLLEHLCWYVPEFSALWRPFVEPSPVNRGSLVFSAYCGLVHLYMAGPLYRSILRDLASLAEGLVRDTLRFGAWRY